MKEEQARTVSVINDLLSRQPNNHSAEARAVGSDRIIVENVSEIQRAWLDEAMTLSTLEIYHARNVTTRLRTRVYEVSEEVIEDGFPVVRFKRSVNSFDDFGPESDEYADMISDWDKVLDAGDLENAQPLRRANGNVVPEFTFTPEGAKKMEAWSRAVMSQGEFLAFVIDGRVLSIAPLRDGAIVSDTAIIDGDFEPEAVVRLTSKLSIAALDIKLTLIKEEKYP